MGTRGLWGFRYERKDKLTYNHYDSYPTGLGEAIRKFVKSHSIADMKKIATKIELVDSQSKPTAEQIEACSEWTDLSVSNQSTEDWYCLLRNAQGEPEAYASGLKYMIDSQDFIKDSLFCEYAYIINLDTEKVEFYIGFQNTPQKNRYKHTKEELQKMNKENPVGEPYYNCKLHMEIPIKEFRKTPMAALERSISEN